MTDPDLHEIRVAAADREMAEFGLDRAAYAVEEVVVEALEQGAPIEAVAKAAGLPVPAVIELAGTDEKVLIAGPDKDAVRQ